MLSAKFLAADPREVGLDPAKIDALFARAERDVEQGILPSCQLAIARNGKIAAMRAFGRAVQGGVEKPASKDTLYAIFSCTKAIISSAIWILIGERKLEVSERAASVVPEFGSNGKDPITIEQLLTHVAGFPNAPYPQHEWLDRGKRLERFAKWRLEWPIGSKFEYHPTSGFWVLGEIIERRSGQDFREFVRDRIAAPLGLPDLRVGLPRGPEQDRMADLCHVGEALSAEELRALGFPDLPENEVTEAAILGFNDPSVREAGVPGGGGVMTAGDLALFYQGLLHDFRGAEPKVWKPEVIREAIRVRTGAYRDAAFGVPISRGLGVEIAGGDGHANLRGFGRTSSPETFGHGGAGGQIGWADPATGISVGYCTNGFDRNVIRQGRRGVAISSLADVCAA